jgi:hypothetical protein
MPPALVADLRALWKASQEQRLALGLGRSQPDDLVFTMWGHESRTPSPTIGYAPAWSPIGESRTHRGRRLGHNPKITLSVYGHLYGSTDDKAAQAVEAMFAPNWRDGVRTNRRSVPVAISTFEPLAQMLTR